VKADHSSYFITTLNRTKKKKKEKEKEEKRNRK